MLTSSLKNQIQSVFKIIRATTLTALLCITVQSCKKTQDFSQYREIETLPATEQSSDSRELGPNHPPIPAAPPQVSDFRKIPDGKQQNRQQTPSGVGEVDNSQESSLKWKTPDGWQEVRGEGMRTVTFVIQEDNQQLECTVIRLPGPAGGIENNVRRWLQQLGIRLSSDESFQKFLDGQQKFVTADKSDGLFINMTTLLGSDLTSEQSGMASIIQMGGNTVFVKLFGSKKVLRSHHNNFLSLSQSLTWGP